MRKKSSFVRGNWPMLAVAMAAVALALVFGHEYLVTFEGVVTRTQDDYDRGRSGDAETEYRVFFRKADGTEASAVADYSLYLRAKPGMILRKKRWTLRPEVFDVPAHSAPGR